MLTLGVHCSLLHQFSVVDAKAEKIQVEAKAAKGASAKAENLDTPGGLCVNDSDCNTTIRSIVPPVPTGPGLCDCYAASHISPFDESEGQKDIARARCAGDACDAFEAYCPLAPGDNGMAECALRTI